MINPDSESLLRETETYAPARLARSDVDALRRLYEQAWSTQLRDWTSQLNVFVDRRTARRTLARLGHPEPCITIRVCWSVLHELGLDVEVVAHTRLGASQSRRLRIGTHRFRCTSTQAQFCREVARLVRLGLGWLKAEATTLKEILQ